MQWIPSIIIQGMHFPKDLAQAFHRNCDGSWTAIRQVGACGYGFSFTLEPGTILEPGGRVYAIDIVGWLEDNARNTPCCQ